MAGLSIDRFWFQLHDFIETISEFLHILLFAYITGLNGSKGSKNRRPSTVLDPNVFPLFMEGTNSLAVKLNSEITDVKSATLLK